MPKLLMLRGLPGSGKSTFARKLVDEQNYVRVNKDDLRAMLNNGKHSKFKEEAVLNIRDFIIEQTLRRGGNVVVDDTNLHPKHQKQLEGIAYAVGDAVRFEINDSFLDVPIEQCIQNDLKRINSVGEQVIKRMDKEARRAFPERFMTPEQGYYPWKMDRRTCIIVDIDGTVALLNGRDPYDGRTCEEDPVNKPIASIVNQYTANRTKVIFMSGRSDEFREQTQRWLDKQGWVDCPLYMRKAGDSRKDNIVKEELFDEHIRDKFNVLFCLDDRNQIVELWRRLGLTCLQVAPGDF